MRGRFGGIGALLGGALLAVGVLACATATQSGSSGQTGELADVRVEADGDATVVTLVGPDRPVFTAFQQTDPDRVVVDLTAVRSERMMDTVLVNDGLVSEVSVSPFSTGTGESMMRVEVTLARPADYEVTPGGDGLSIRIEPMSDTSGEEMSGDALAEASLQDDPWALVADPEEAAEAAPTWDAPAAGRLMAVEATSMDQGALIRLRADGTITSAVSFTLEDPDRLVIDLPEMRNEAPSGRIELDSPHAARVRIGQHEDMVRVVVDAGGAAQPFEGRRVAPAADGLVIALGSGPDLDAAMSAESSPPTALASETETGTEAETEVESETATAAEPAPAMQAMPLEAPAEMGELVTIYGVEYDVQADRDRIVVLAERPVDYLVYEPSPTTVVVTIEGAVLDPEAAARIAPEPGGPVSLVTAFDQPEQEIPEVRLVLERAANLKPEVTRQGSMLVVDFPRTGQVAVVPPVLTTPPATSLIGDEAAASQPTGAMPGAEPALAAAPAPQAPSMEIEPAMATGAPPEAVPASLEPPAAIDILHEGGLIDGKEYTGRRISLDFKDVDIADVLRLIAEVSDLNVIAGDEVKGRVTIRLVDVPWDQALDVILLTKGLAFMRIGNVLRIAPSEVIKQEEEMRLQERRAKEKLEDLVVKLQPVNYANVKDVRKMVERLLSPRGSVNMDERTNTLILKDIPSVIDEATALIKAIDTQTPQVMIEAKIVEANLDFSRELGSVWSFGTQPLVDGFDDSSGAREDLGLSQFRLHDANNLVVGNPITAGPTALMNLGAFILDEKLNLDLQLQAAEVNGDGKVISSPRIVTLDNREASIEQGVSIPFQTFENGDAQLEFVDAVLELEVTPHITADKSIIMEINVSRNAPDDSVFTLTGSPAIAKNEVDTETLVKDGQTLVLGGIYVIDKSSRQSRVPYLHRIPFLGWAFKSNEVSDSRKELLIFVTPRIVVSPQTAS